METTIKIENQENLQMVLLRLANTKLHVPLKTQAKVVCS